MNARDDLDRHEGIDAEEPSQHGIVQVTPNGDEVRINERPIVIAADEGIKPQTREHFDICRLLGIPRGIVVLTKSDLVDAELLELVELEVRELLSKYQFPGDDLPVCRVSALGALNGDKAAVAPPKLPD